MENYINKRVQLKDKEYAHLVGTIQELYLLADERRNRPNNLYWVLWDNGRRGVCEIKQLNIL